MNTSYTPSQVFRYCPKCGNPDFSPETEKSLKCRSCGFEYFFNMNAAVAAIIRNEADEILFTIRKHKPAEGMLDLPGGFVDLGETAEEAVVREIYEELNLQVDTMEYIGTFTNEYVFGGIEYQTLDLVFNCHVSDFAEIHAADDVAGYLFKNATTVNPDEIGLLSVKKILAFITSH